MSDNQNTPVDPANGWPKTLEIMYRATGGSSWYSILDYGDLRDLKDGAVLKYTPANDAATLSRMLAQAMAALIKYGSHAHANVKDLCERAKHSDYPCTCGLDAAIATAKGCATWA